MKDKIFIINPATEEIINEFDEMSDQAIESCLEQSDKVFTHWSEFPIEKRCELIKNLGQILREKKEKLAELITLEMGKPITQSIAEIEKCAWLCDYYKDSAPNQLADIPVATEYSKSYVAFLPLGPILAIMPWNFPFWQVFRFAVPNVIAGNTALLKHSRNTMGCAVEIEKLFNEAGFPKGVFINFIIGSSKVAKVIQDNRIKGVTLTGSTPVGKEVAKISGWNLKKTVMELGGSDPYVVLKDAKLEDTVQTCISSRLINNGQSCISAKRFIVEKPIVNDFIDLFKEKMKTIVMGNPLDSKTNLGPLARKDLRFDIHNQVERSVAQGAHLELGGTIPETKGYFYPATILTNVKPGMPAFDEETFGPVAAIIEARDEEEAIELANQSNFGLGAAVFTSDIEKGNYIAKYKIQAGNCFVNDFVKSDPRLPFGGIKESGYGRELSVFGIREFVNIKTVCVK